MTLPIGYHLRPATADDDPALLRLRSRLEPDAAPISLERLQAERAERDRTGGEVWAVVDEDGLVGAASFSAAWWTDDPGVYAIEIQVDPAHQRRGIGSSVFHLLRSRLCERRAKRMLAWLRSDSPAGRAFAARHGFQETGQSIREYRLSLPEARTAEAERRLEQLRAEGIRIATLAELPAPGPEFFHALHGVWANVPGDPSDLERLRASFPRWAQEVLHGPGLSPDTHWVALDRDRPVGMTFLRRLTDHAAENDYTSVAAPYRGRGIAAALKLEAIRWGRRNDLTEYCTATEPTNLPMVRLNERLGYRPGSTRLEVSKDLD